MIKYNKMERPNVPKQSPTAARSAVSQLVSLPPLTRLHICNICGRTSLIYHQTPKMCGFCKKPD
jgi:hypothetical protein